MEDLNTHRSVSSLLPAVFPRPAPQLGVPRAALHVDAVDDVEELLDHRDFFEDKLNFSIETLQKRERKCNENTKRIQ